jgi:nucleoside-diphosphate-sugar epimerase
LYDISTNQVRLLPVLVDELRRDSQHIIVTGAGGWLGQAALEALDGALGEMMPMRVTAFASRAKTLLLRSGRVIVAHSYDSLDQLAIGPSLILHFAFLTRGFAKQDGYIETNCHITRTMQRFIARNGAIGLFLPSSGAVYGAGRVPHQNLDTDPYGALKYEDELVFGAQARQLGFPAVIIRIFNLAGPCMNNLAGYALACIITDILHGGPINLRAAHPVFRAYAHIGDVLNIAFSLLLGRLELPVFDTAGQPSLEIGELAQLASRLVAGHELPVNRPEWRTGTPDCYLGDMQSYAQAARLAGVTLQPLEAQIQDTATYISSLAKKSD